MVIDITNSLQCPYCSTQLQKTTFRQGKGFFSYSCKCDEYPVIFGILYLKKDDFQTHKKILQHLKKGQQLKAFYTALIGTAKTHKFIIMLTYYLKFVLGIKLKRTHLLQILYIAGPARSWFSYLLKNHNRNTLQTATYVCINQVKSKQTYNIIDVGAGIGFFADKIRTRDTYVGLDKSFLSTAIAQLYRQTKNCLYICSEVESGLPFSSNVFHQILFLDTFAWILNKNFLIQESARILKKNGQFTMVNVHEKNADTYWWGYGISANTLFSLLAKNHFKEISFFGNSVNSRGLQSVTKTSVEPLGYSLMASKGLHG